MSALIPLNIAVEDILSDAVVRRLLSLSGKSFTIGATFMRGGQSYLKARIEGFNNAAKGTPFFVLTDLDQHECASTLIKDWLPHDKNPNLIFRVAVIEVEAWLMADRQNFAKFLGISSTLIPKNIESVSDPKALLLKLSKKSRYSKIKKDLVPPPDSDRKIGPNYNGRLIDYVVNKWNPEDAKHNSHSLKSAVERIKGFKLFPSF